MTTKIQIIYTIDKLFPSPGMVNKKGNFCAEAMASSTDFPLAKKRMVEIV